MARASATQLPAALIERATKIKLVAFDVDGVLTDGSIWIGADGHELAKAFNAQDGLGLKLLRENDIEVALITARDSAAVAARARELALRHVYQGQRDKLECLKHLCRALELRLDQVAYTGDDLPDLAAMQACGLAIAVANAHPWVMARAQWCTEQRGGAGAVREVCDFLLAAQGKADAVLQRHLPSA